MMEIKFDCPQCEIESDGEIEASIQASLTTLKTSLIATVHCYRCETEFEKKIELEGVHDFIKKEGKE